MGAQVLLATQNKSFRASKSHTGVIDTTVKHDFRHRLSQPLKHISMNPVNSNGREEDSPDSLALTQSKKGAEEGRLRDTGRTGVREGERGRRSSEGEVDKKHTGSGAELLCQWRRSWMPVGGSAFSTIDPQLSQDP